MYCPFSVIPPFTTVKNHCKSGRIFSSSTPGNTVQQMSFRHLNFRNKDVACKRKYYPISLQKVVECKHVVIVQSACSAAMAYDIGWIIPRLRNPGALWSCASSLTVAVVGLFSKIIIGRCSLSPSSLPNTRGCPLVASGMTLPAS